MNKMKSIIYLLTLLLVISLTASCSKDNGGDSIGNDLAEVNTTYNKMMDFNNQEGQTPKLTESNYLFESDLYVFYLKTEINNLKTNINAWGQLTPEDPDYKQAQALIMEAEESLTRLYEQLNSIKPIEGIKPPEKPRPCMGKDNDPIPCIDPKKFNLLVTTDDVELLSLTLVDGKNTTIAVNNAKETHLPLPEYKNMLYYTSVTLKEIQPMGEGILSIQKQVNGKIVVYKVPLLFRED